MATEEEETLPGISRLSHLTSKLNNMLKKPTLDTQLSETLDSFIAELSHNDHYLANGIVNIKFAEAGLFLENSSVLYGKRVDLLWDNALQYQMQLCAYNKSQEENAKEAEKITQRINQNKRKKVVQNIVEKLAFHGDLINDISRSNKVLETYSSLIRNDNLSNTWKEINKNKTVDNHSNGESSSHHESRPVQSTPCNDFTCNINQNVYLDSGEKLASHSDLVMNRLLPYIGSFNKIMEPERIIGGNNQDWLLQKYMKHIGVTYQKFWLERLGDDFNLFQQRVHQIDTLLPSEANAVGLSNLSVVNLIRLPEELMAEYAKNNDVHVRAMIHDLLVKERQSSAARIKKSSERFSEADSAYHEMFNDTDSRSGSRPDIAFISQHSLVDSGTYDDELDMCNGETILNEETPIYSGDISEAITCDTTIPIASASTNLSQAQEGNSHEDIGNTRVDVVTMSNVTDTNQDNSIIPSVTTTQDDILNTNIGGDNGTNNSVQDDSGTLINPTDLSLNSGINDGDNLATDLNTVQDNAIASIVTNLESRECNSNIVSNNLATFHNKTVALEDHKRSSVNKNSTPVSITVRSVIKPLPERSSKTQKRKIVTDLDNGEPSLTPKRKCVPRTKWLKTVVALFGVFESFYVRHYMAEDGEEGHEMFDVENDHLTQQSLISLPVGSGSTDAVVLDMRENENVDCISNNNYDMINDVTEDQIQNYTDELELQCTLSPITSSVEPVNCDVRDNEINIPSGSSDLVNASTSSGYVSDMHSFSRTKAVSDWRSFIEPKLKELHKSEFDIHRYGGQIINAIPEGEMLPFNDLVCNQKSSEVCRYFLAALQLANTYNIELIAPQGKLANEALKVKLLTKERYHEHLDEYEAPSENDFRERMGRAQAACSSHFLHSTPKTSSHKKSKKRLKL
ncbi:hypothetical protein RI129_001293 [Pyrocoelia pectoralis]|uniref:Condensin-2 complex subunit H2 C-terminal domain-containing protein n=1 Tax=Pyrocoelia pectoralis TaxID=417401 RepID=A0AAN7VV63_9COLE